MSQTVEEQVSKLNLEAEVEPEDEEGVAEQEETQDGASAAAKKKRRRKAKKKAAASTSDAAAAAGGLSVSGQTVPPSIPVRLLPKFASGEFPVGEEMPHPGDS
jgi:hypothetical protein